MTLSPSKPIRCNLKAQGQGRGCNPELIVDILADDTARDIYFYVDEPTTVKEIKKDGDIPTSTAYRKIETLVDAGLIKPTPQHSSAGETKYVKAIECISVTYSDPIEIRCVKSGLSLYCEG